MSVRQPIPPWPPARPMPTAALSRIRPFPCGGHRCAWSHDAALHGAGVVRKSPLRRAAQVRGGMPRSFDSRMVVTSVIVPVYVAVIGALITWAVADSYKHWVLQLGIGVVAT